LHRFRKNHEGGIFLKTDYRRTPGIKLYLKLGFRPKIKVGRFDHSREWERVLKDLGFAEIRIESRRMGIAIRSIRDHTD